MNTFDFTIWEDAKIYSTRSLLLQKILESYALDDGKGIEQFFFFFLGAVQLWGVSLEKLAKHWPSSLQYLKMKYSWFATSSSQFFSMII